MPASLDLIISSHLQETILLLLKLQEFPPEPEVELCVIIRCIGLIDVVVEVVVVIVRLSPSKENAGLSEPLAIELVGVVIILLL